MTAHKTLSKTQTITLCETIRTICSGYENMEAFTVHEDMTHKHCAVFSLMCCSRLHSWWWIWQTFNPRTQSLLWLGHRRTEWNTDRLTNWNLVSSRDRLKGPLSYLYPLTELSFRFWYALDPSTRCWNKQLGLNVWRILVPSSVVCRRMEKNKLNHFAEVNTTSVTVPLCVLHSKTELQAMWLRDTNVDTQLFGLGFLFLW